MKAFYCDHFGLPLPSDHRFPEAKYRLLRAAIAADPALVGVELLVGEAASAEAILRVHTRPYFERLLRGTLEPDEIRRIGFPWSPQLVERARRSVGGTLAAAAAAGDEGIAVNLAGGTHHAFPDHGEGFCLLNDAAIAARDLQASGRAERVLIVDCDVHHGNGTAAIFAGDQSVFTFSIHGRKNYPAHKPPSDLDLALEDGTGDDDYLAALDHGLERALGRFPADFAIYLAGADPYVGDRLGRLAVTKDGLRRRDRMVIGRCRRMGLPMVVVMAGGYAKQVEDIVAVHLQTVHAALDP